MSICGAPHTDAGQKVEELRRELDRSQAFLAGLEAQYAKRDTKKDISADVVTVVDTASVDEVCDTETLKEPKNPFRSTGSLNVFRTRLTEWFGKKAAKKAPKMVEDAPRRLSFSRVNIEFQSEIPAVEIPGLAACQPSTSPQLPTRLLQRSWTTTTNHQSSPVAMRAMSCTASSSSPTSSMYGMAAGGGGGGGSATSLICVSAAPRPHSDASAAMPTFRRSSLESRPSLRLIPTLTAVASQPQRRTVFRDTIWSANSDSQPGEGPFLPSPSFRNSQDRDDSVPIPVPSANPTLSLRTSRAGSGVGYSNSSSSRICRIESSLAARDRALMDTQMPQVPQLYGMGLKSQQVPRPSIGNEPHQRPEASSSNLRAKSFTLGTSQSWLVPRGGTHSLTLGAVGEDETRYTAARSLQPPPWMEGVSSADAEAEFSSPPLIDLLQGKDPHQQQQQQPYHLQYALDSGKQLTASPRLAGIPEGGAGRTLVAARSRSRTGRRSVEFSATQFVTVLPPAAGSPATADTARGGCREQDVRRQTWSNEVFVPVTD